MSPPSPSKRKLQTPLFAATSSPKSRKDRRKDLRKAVTENTLVASGTTGTTLDATTEAPAPPTNADSGDENIAVGEREDSARELCEVMAANALVELARTGGAGFSEGSSGVTGVDLGEKSVRNMVDDAVRAHEKRLTMIVVLKLGLGKKVEGKGEEEEVETGKHLPQQSRELATKTTSVRPATTDIASSNNPPAPYTKSDLNNRIRRGDFNISANALNLLGQGTKTFILNLLKKSQNEQEAQNPIKARQQKLAKKHEAERVEVRYREMMRKQREETLSEALKRLWDELRTEMKANPGDSEETRLRRQAVLRAKTAWEVRYNRRPYDDASCAAREAAMAGMITTGGLSGQVRQTAVVGSMVLGTKGAEKGFELTTGNSGSGGESIDTKPSERFDTASDAVKVLEKHGGNLKLSFTGEAEGERVMEVVEFWKFEGDTGPQKKQKTEEEWLSPNLKPLRERADRLAETERLEIAANKATALALEQASKLKEKEAKKEAKEKKRLEVTRARFMEPSDSRKARLKREAAARMTAPVIELTSRPKPGDRATTPNDPGTTAASASASKFNPKLQASSARIQQPTVTKRAAPTTSTTPTANTDELLTNILRNITIFKANEPPTARTSKPQTQFPLKVIPRPANPFYLFDMTLALAAQNIAAYFREAADWLTFWHISTSPSILIEMSRKPTSTLCRIFCHLKWTAEFLRLGRAGWDSRCLPDDFFGDVLPLVMVTCGKLEKLGEWRECEGMMATAWKDAEEVGEMLATVRNVRVRDGKGEVWERMLRDEDGWGKGEDAGE